MKTWDKVKSPISFAEEKKKRAKDIFEEFEQFSTGYRCLFLIQRHKEGGETQNSRLIKKITRNSEEYLKAIEELVDEQMSSELTLRIYASVNERNFPKAIRQFKFEQLEADYYDQTQKENFYLDVKNRFIGCLMQPAQRATNFFLFDVDTVEGNDTHGETLHCLPPELIITQYKTKNGWHIITQPFDYTKITLPNGVEMKKDGLLLLSF